MKILIVEGNDEAGCEQSRASGTLTQAEHYRRVLHALRDDIESTIVCPSDGHAQLPGPNQLEDFEGIVWTGSGLNVYDGGDAIERQIDFMKIALGRNTRIFGSCWGLQIATVATGGAVAANPAGREIGVARDIQINKQGLAHPMYRGKFQTFDAVAVHLDHVVKLPEGACVLSANAMSDVQAIEMKRGPSVFWGVQYHPEFDLGYIAGMIRKYGEALVAEAICADLDAVNQWADDMDAVHMGKDSEALAERYRLGQDVTDFSRRLREVSNWLTWIAD